MNQWKIKINNYNWYNLIYLLKNESITCLLVNWFGTLYIIQKTSSKPNLSYSSLHVDWIIDWIILF